jgi:hypothetical protein
MNEGGTRLHYLRLLLLDPVLAVCRLDAKAPQPSWLAPCEFFSVTRTRDELSIVCPQDVVPPDVKCERGWRCLRVAGTLDFGIVGILASLTAPLAEAGISVFAISTFDTDYLLIKDEFLDKAMASLREAGHAIGVSPPG